MRPEERLRPRGTVLRIRTQNKKEFPDFPFIIVRDAITKVYANAIVNSANPKTVIGGVDTAIYRTAGERELLAERKIIGKIAPGQVARTSVFRLNAGSVIHTVGPFWMAGNHGERETLAACYANSFALATEFACESIAFPMPHVYLEGVSTPL